MSDRKFDPLLASERKIVELMQTTFPEILEVRSGLTIFENDGSGIYVKRGSFEYVVRDNGKEEELK